MNYKSYKFSPFRLSTLIKPNPSQVTGHCVSSLAHRMDPGVYVILRDLFYVVSVCYEGASVPFHALSAETGPGLRVAFPW